MKPDYKNWVPKSMVAGLFAGTAAAFGLFLAFGATGLILRGRARATRIFRRATRSNCRLRMRPLTP